jgi:hypothetical protein
MARLGYLAALLAFFALPCSAGTYYICAATGSPCNASDSNAGTSKTATWLHAPGMPNCSGTCASHTPSPGDNFIFRGGDSWHFGNSSASPYTGGEWLMSNWNGTDASCIYEGTQTGCIYAGVDVTWYSGASWVRPVLTSDNPICSSSSCSAGTYPNVSSCAYQVGSNNNMMQGGIAWILDNFEITGFCTSRNPASGGPSQDIIVGYGGSGTSGSGMFYETNLYIHGWSDTATAGESNNTVACTILGGGGNGLQTITYLVIDGSDSDPQACSWGTFPSFYHFKDSIVRYMTQGVGAWCHDIHDVIFEHSINPHWPTHANVLECNNDAYGNAVNQPQNTPNVFYNLIFRHDAPGMAGNPDFWTCPPGGVAEYYFNLLLYDLAGEGQSIAGPAGYGSNCSNAGGQFIFNSTYVDVTQPCSLNSGNNGTNGQYLTVLNEHLIGASTGTALYDAFISPGCTGYNTSTNIGMTDSTATSQGYTTGSGGTSGGSNTCANDSTTPCAPTASGNGTVGAGANHQAYCTTLASFTGEQAIGTDAANACKYGTTDGCTYNTSTHSMSCPAQTAVARPSSGAWDSGAYEFSPSSLPFSLGNGGIFAELFAPQWAILP